MTWPPHQPSLLPSLLDRLLDDDDPQRSHLRGLEQAVRRDLENLLNTRSRNVLWGTHLEELDQSLLSYGLPDFTSVSLVSATDRQKFCRLIEGIIRQNEPRLL